MGSRRMFDTRFGKFIIRRDASTRENIEWHNANIRIVIMRGDARTRENIEWPNANIRIVIVRCDACTG